MAKVFLDELIAELLKLQVEDVEKARSAVENGERIPAPASPKTIFETVNRVAEAHKVTADELETLLSVRDNISSADIKLLQILKTQNQD